tara:strand:- start:2157 stop:2639 length:483 start_codon:yes stop_codon:yes gene_type:complete
MSYKAKLEGRIDLGYMNNVMSKQQMILIGEAAAAIIQEETQQGHKDENGKRFKPYTKEYAKWRQSQPQKYGVQVDLTLTGNMLNSMQCLKEFTTNKRAVLGFINTQRGRDGLLPVQKMEYTNRKRPWFGFGRKNSKRRQRILTRASEIFIEALTRLQGRM